MKQKAQKLSEENEAEVGQDFTGLARSVEAFDNQGFRNFRVVTLYIVRGKVVRQEYSDPWASFETISKLEIQNEMAIHHLNNVWEPGKTLSR
jgi:hypothetical protein